MAELLAAVALLNEASVAKRLHCALTMDPKSEKFIGNDRASEMLTRPYRKGYVVPEQV